MTRTDHFAHSTPGFPVFSLGFLSDRTVVLGGGGGSSKSGVKNKLKLGRIDVKAKAIEILDEYEFGPEEDSPNSLAVNVHSNQVVAGVNQSPSNLEQGKNEHCRMFDVENDKFTLLKTRQTFSETYVPKGNFPLQKLTVFSRDGSYLAVGIENNQLSVLSYPSLELAFQPLSYTDVRPGDLYDVDFDDSGRFMAATTSSTIHIYAIPSPSTLSSSTSTDLSSLPALKEIKTISKESVKAQAGLSFRAARFGRSSTSSKLFAILNDTSPTPRAKRNAPKKSYACFWSIESVSPTTSGEDERKVEEKSAAKEVGEVSWKMGKSRVIAGKPITAVDINETGTFLAYGCSDKSVGVIDSTSFAPLLRILDAHDFPAMTVRFSPSADLLLSASFDNSIRVISIPSTFDSTYSTPVAVLFLTLFLAFLAVLFQLRQQGSL